MRDLAWRCVVALALLCIVAALLLHFAKGKV